GVGWLRVGIVGDDILARGPRPVVERLEEAHEVRRHWDAWCEFLQDGALLLEACQPRVGAEALPIKLLRRVDDVRRAARRADLLPVPIDLAPERCAPGSIQRVEGRVALPQPFTEGGSRGLAEALRDVTGVFVVDMPQ